MGSLYRPKYPHPEGEYVSKGEVRYKVSPVFWMKYRDNGRIVRESCETEDEKAARKLLQKREVAVDEGRPVAPRASRVLIRKLAEDLKTHHRTKKRPASLERLEYSLQHLLPFFGHRRAIQLTTKDVNGYIDKRQKEGAANGTINREVGALKRMFNLAIQAEELHRRPHIPTLPEDNVRTGFFEREQFEAVRRHLPEYARPVVSFAYITGWRAQSEILPLQWRQVKFEAGTVRLEPGTTKNKEGRTFIMTPDLRDVPAGAAGQDGRTPAEAGPGDPLGLPSEGGADPGLPPILEDRLQERRGPWAHPA